LVGIASGGLGGSHLWLYNDPCSLFGGAECGTPAGLDNYFYDRLLLQPVKRRISICIELSYQKLVHPLLSYVWDKSTANFSELDYPQAVSGRDVCYGLREGYSISLHAHQMGKAGVQRFRC